MSSKYVAPEKPLREPDHVSKRGVHYWWSPEWVRGLDSNNDRFGRIKAVKNTSKKVQWYSDHPHMPGQVLLYSLSKSGNLNYIQGSIQTEFIEWHEQRKIDYFFLADDPEALDEMILSGEV